MTRVGIIGYGLAGEVFHAPAAGAYELFYAGLREALDTGGAPPVDPHDALTALRVIEAARRSAADRTVNEIKEEA